MEPWKREIMDGLQTLSKAITYGLGELYHEGGEPDWRVFALGRLVALLESQAGIDKKYRNIDPDVVVEVYDHLNRCSHVGIVLETRACFGYTFFRMEVCNDTAWFPAAAITTVFG